MVEVAKTVAERRYMIVIDEVAMYIRRQLEPPMYALRYFSSN